MQRKRGELVPIGDALSGMGGPVQAIRDDSPQARHSFTVADQVNRLVSASEAARRPGLHGANDGAVLPAPKLPRQTGSSTKSGVNGPYTL